MRGCHRAPLNEARQPAKWLPLGLDWRGAVNGSWFEFFELSLKSRAPPFQSPLHARGLDQRDDLLQVCNVGAFT
jgi:hypothetical protein